MRMNVTQKLWRQTNNARSQTLSANRILGSRATTAPASRSPNYPNGQYKGRLLSAHMQPIKQVMYGLNWINLRYQILTYGANVSTYFLPPGHENENIQGVIPGGAF